jgi:hypothetical protein
VTDTTPDEDTAPTLTQRIEQATPKKLRELAHDLPRGSKTTRAEHVEAEGVEAEGVEGVEGEEEGPRPGPGDGGTHSAPPPPDDVQYLGDEQSPRRVRDIVRRMREDHHR